MQGRRTHAYIDAVDSACGLVTVLLVKWKTCWTIAFSPLTADGRAFTTTKYHVIRRWEASITSLSSHPPRCERR